MPTDKISFENRDGHQLAARLHRPDGHIRAWALFAHCFTCSKDLKAARKISGALAARGVAVMRFDFTGLGESDGDFADTNFSSNVDDLVAAAEYLAEIGGAPRLLVGHSLGGAAVIPAALRLDSVLAVATIGAPSDPAHVRHLLEGKLDDIETDGEAQVKLAGRSFTVKKQFLDDIGSTQQRDNVAALRRALLILHSPQDQTVGIDNARQLYTAAMHPKSFVSLDGADHLLSDPADATYVAEVIATWATRYLPDVDETGPREAKSTPDATVARMAHSDGFAVEVAAGGHRLRADEPTDVGGTDTGPTPYGLLTAALGACTTMTLRMYAERKGWPLDDAIITLRHDKVHAGDCSDCESTEGRIDVIEREIELIGDLDEAMRERLLSIADKCPVHRTLHSEVVVRSKLVEIDTDY